LEFGLTEKPITTKKRHEDEEQLITTTKRKHEDEEQLITTTKRKHEDETTTKSRDLGELTDFALEIINKLDSSDESKQQIVRLALERNVTFINIKESLMNESTKINKFISLMNSQFNMVSILYNIFLDA
jgi:hypothetical protein